jgi:hypothetical protein
MSFNLIWTLVQLPLRTIRFEPPSNFYNSFGFEMQIVSLGHFISWNVFQFDLNLGSTSPPNNSLWATLQFLQFFWFRDANCEFGPFHFLKCLSIWFEPWFNFPSEQFALSHPPISTILLVSRCKLWVWAISFLEMSFNLIWTLVQLPLRTIRFEPPSNFYNSFGFEMQIVSLGHFSLFLL